MKNPNRSARLPFALFSAGVNMALFAAGTPALAQNHGFAVHTQAASMPGAASASLTAGANPAAFSPRDTFSSAGLAGTVPLNSTGPAAIHQYSQTNALNAQMSAQMNALTRAFNANENVNFNLGSSQASLIITPSVISVNDSVTISMGGADRTFRMGDSVTPAELVAIYQARGGAQSISLDRFGKAEGGSFAIADLINGSSVHVSGLVIPKNVTAIDNLSGDQNLHLTGNLFNYGSIEGLGGAGSALNISALNVVNARTGLITTVVQDANNAIGGADLSVAAVNGLRNVGTISSASNLSINAPYIENSGLLTSAKNITLSAPYDQGLLINNLGGTISAPNGAINVREAGYTGAANTLVYGGNLLSQQVNLNSGAGIVDVNVEQLTGILNSNGSAVHVQASTSNLILGTQCLVGDPTYYNDNGNIVIDGDITVGENLAIAASGNITATSNTSKIVARTPFFTGQNITIIAGADITPTSGTPTTLLPPLGASSSITISGGSATGGNIDFSGANTSLIIDSSGSTFAGGNVTMAAFHGNTSEGSILLPAMSVIDARLTSLGTTDGNITLIAGALSGTAIAASNITGGNVRLVNATPTIINGPLVINKTGDITAGIIGADASARLGGDIVLGGAITESRTYSLQVVTGGTVTLPSVSSIKYSQIVIVGDKGVTLGGPITSQNGTTIVTGGDITGAGSAILANEASNAFTMVAGADFSINANSATASINQILINGRSTTGGNIDLSAGTYVIATTAGVGSGQAASNAVLAAFRLDSNAANTGRVSLNRIVADGDGSGNNGSIEIVAGSANAKAISIDTLESATGMTGTGSISLLNVQPNTQTAVALLGTTPTFVGDAPSGTTGGIAVTGKITVDGGNLTIMQAAALTLPQVQGNIGDYRVQASGNVTVADSFKANFASINSGGIVAVNSPITAANTAIASGGGVTFGATSGISGGGITIVTAGDIKALGNGISISTDGGSGGKALTMIAGADFTVTNDKIQITGQAGSGGSIDFASSGKASIFSTGSATGDGGAMALAAFSGNIYFNSTSLVATGATGKSAGEVTLVSGKSSFGGIQLPGIDVSTGNGGNIYISASQPNATPANPIKIDLATSSITDGSVRGGATVAGGGGFTLGTLKMNGGTLSLMQDTGITSSSEFGSLSGAGTVVAISKGSIFVNSQIDAQTLQFGAGTTISLLTDVIAPGGITLIAGGDVNATSTPVLLATDSAGNAGQVNVVAGAIFNYDGTNIKVTGLNTNGSINFDQMIAISAGTVTGSGGDVNLIAAKSITMNAVGATINTDGATINGSVTLNAGLKTGTAIDIQNIDLTNSGAANGKGGKVNLQSGTLIIQAIAPLVFGPSGLVSGAVIVTPNTDGDIQVGNIRGTGSSTVSISSSRNLIAGTIDANAGASINNGGSVAITVKGTESVQIGGTQGTSVNYIKSISVAGNAGFTNGSISVLNLDDTDAGNRGITLVGTPINLGSAGGGNLTLIAGRAAGDTIALGAYDNISVSNTGTNAGAIALIGNKITTDSGFLSLSANDYFQGGSIIYETANNVPLILDSKSGLSFSAAGPTGGGFLEIQNGGSITFDPTAPNFVFTPPGSPTYAGSLTLRAGYFKGDAIPGANANLLVTGSLKSDGAYGGKFTLASNSPTVFTIGSTGKITNGVMGTISVAGSYANGSISAGNFAGGLTNTIPLTKVTSITLFAGGSGDLVIGDPVGTALNPINSGAPSTYTATLKTLGSGSIIQSKSTDTIGAAILTLATGKGGSVGGKGSLTVNAPDLTITAGGNSNVINTALNVQLAASSAAGQFTLTAANKLNLADLNVGSATINARTVSVGGNIVGTATGNVTITASGNGITASGTPDISTGGLVTVSAPNGYVLLGSVGQTIAPLKFAGTGLYSFSTGSITAGDSITIKATASSGFVGVNTNALKTLSASGAISLSTVGAGMRVDVIGDIDAAKSLTITSANSDIHIGGIIGKTSAPDTVTLTAAKTLELGGSINVDNTITLKSTYGPIVSYDTITVNSPTNGVVAISAGGAGANITIAAVNASKSVTISAPLGQVAVGYIGASGNAPDTISLTAGGDLSVYNSITAENTINIKTSGPGSSNIVRIGGNVLATSTKGSITITTSGANCNLDNHGDLTAATVTVNTPKGTITSDNIGTNAAYPNLTSKVVLNAANGIFLQKISRATDSFSATSTSVDNSIVIDDSIIVGKGTTSTNVGTGTITITAGGGISSSSGVSILAGKSVTITSTKGGLSLYGSIGNSPGFLPNTVTLKAFGDLSVTNVASYGPISISTTGKGAGDDLSVYGAVSTVNAPVSIVASGSFLYLTNASIMAGSTSKTTKATVLLQNSNKSGYISMTTSSIATSGPGGGDINIAIGAPAKGFNTTAPGPQIIVDNSATPANNAYFGTPGAVDPSSIGTLTLKGANIIFTATQPNSIHFASTNITADPPVSAAAPLVATRSLVASVPTIMSTAANQLIQTVTAPTQKTETVTARQSLSDFSSLTNLNALSQLSRSPNMISETELVGGEVPVALLDGADVDLGVSVVNSAADVENGQYSKLTRGALLAVPTSDTTIKTAYGDVWVAAKSIVLIVSTHNGLAVYNLDDRKSGAVTVTAGGRVLSMRPGTSTFITAQSAHSLEHINPIQLIGHRHIYEHKLGSEMKAYRSEFAVHSAFAALKPLRHMLNSNDRATRETANHFLKTASILMGLQAGGAEFKRMLRPQLTASAL